MLSLLLFLTARKKKNMLEDLVAEIQSGDESLLNHVLEDYKPFVKRSVSSVCKRYIRESDDEFSIGLIAFHDAIMRFDLERGGSLLAFADVIIKRKVIDYIRLNQKHSNVMLDYMSNEDEGQTSILDQSMSLEEYEKQLDIQKRQEEIKTFSELLKGYNLTFQDLVEQSPKHKDARINALQVAKLVSENKGFCEYLQHKKKLPLKKLEKEVGLSRKTLERNRKYIIALVLILIGDFNYLKDYLKGRLEV